jgi:hypothetical protein
MGKIDIRANPRKEMLGKSRCNSISATRGVCPELIKTKAIGKKLHGKNE